MLATTSAAARTGAFARYHLLQDLGHALGGLLAMLPELLREAFLLEPAASTGYTRTSVEAGARRS